MLFIKLFSRSPSFFHSWSSDSCFCFSSRTFLSLWIYFSILFFFLRSRPVSIRDFISRASLFVISGDTKMMTRDDPYAREWSLLFRDRFGMRAHGLSQPARRSQLQQRGRISPATQKNAMRIRREACMDVVSVKWYREDISSLLSIHFVISIRSWLYNKCYSSYVK